jgi:hypothetical protein
MIVAFDEGEFRLLRLFQQNDGDGVPDHVHEMFFFIRSGLDDDAVHIPLHQVEEDFLLLFRIPLRIAEQHIILFAERVLHRFHEAAPEIVVDIVHDDCDVEGALQPEIPGLFAAPETVVHCELGDPRPGFGGDAGVAVQGLRHRCRRDAQFFCDIVDCHGSITFSHRFESY